LSGGPWPCAGEGTNWSVYLLPYLERNDIWNRLTFNGDSGWTNVQNQPNSSAVNNVMLARDIVLSVYRCPSDPKPELVPNVSNVGGNALSPSIYKVNRNSYVAIAGAVDRLDAARLFRERRNTNATSWSIDFGITAWGGVLVPDWSAVRFGSISDGLSSTMVISEQSDYVTYSNGTKADELQSTSTSNGLFRGHQGPGGGGGRDAQGNLLPAYPGMDSRGQTFTTIRYRINQKTGWVQFTPYEGVSNNRKFRGGPWMGEDANVPLMSAHSGGVNALFADGSVHFLSDNTDLLMLARLATRDDGGVITGVDY
jgi:prepilin-type processing-associated H-X9-DG protein